MLNMRKKDDGAVVPTTTIVMALMLCSFISPPMLMGVSASQRTRLMVPETQEQHRRNLLANELAVTPPMGWNSWNHFNCKIDEKIFKATADALISTGLSKLGYTYVNIGTLLAAKQCLVHLAMKNKMPTHLLLGELII